MSSRLWGWMHWFPPNVWDVLPDTAAADEWLFEATGFLLCAVLDGLRLLWCYWRAQRK